MLTKPKPSPCPICNALCEVTNFDTVGGFMYELTERCPNGHYEAEFDCGSKGWFIGGNLWIAGDTEANRVVMEEKIAKLRKDWQAASE